MAKKTFKLAVKNINNNLNKILNRTFLAKLGGQARDILYKRVKSGKGIDSTESADPKKTTLKRLSSNYVKFRQKQKLGPFGSAGKSNLTLSGEMLESLNFEVTARGFRLYFPSSKHPKSKISISLLSHYVQAQGRPFFGLTKDERRILEVEVQNELRKLARRKT